MTKRTILGATVAVVVLGVAAVAFAASDGTSMEDWGSMNGTSAVEMPPMIDGPSMDGMMMDMMDMMGTMDTDHMSAMSDAMDANDLGAMTSLMSAHHAEMATMMPGAGSGMMGSGSPMGIDQGGHHSP